MKREWWKGQTFCSNIWCLFTCLSTEYGVIQNKWCLKLISQLWNGVVYCNIFLQLLLHQLLLLLHLCNERPRTKIDDLYQHSERMKMDELELCVSRYHFVFYTYCFFFLTNHLLQKREFLWISFLFSSFIFCLWDSNRQQPSYIFVSVHLPIRKLLYLWPLNLVWKYYWLKNIMKLYFINHEEVLFWKELRNWTF